MASVAHPARTLSWMCLCSLSLIIMAAQPFSANLSVQKAAGKSGKFPSSNQLLINSFSFHKCCSANSDINGPMMTFTYVWD